MSKLTIIRYIAVLGVSLLLFGGFIACGAQMYKVSLQNDIDPEISKRVEQNPSSPAYGIHASNGWKKLPIPFKVGTGVSKEQKNLLETAMKRWEWSVGKRLFQYQGIHDGIDGDSFKNLYSSLEDAVNGNYLDFDWDKTGKPKEVLATTIWQNDAKDESTIDTSDIRYNTQLYLIGDSLKLTSDGTREVVDMESLALHELGHLLGLAHIEESVDGHSIMNPSLYIGEGLATRKLSGGDIKRVQSIYGCLGKACDIDALVEEMEYNAKNANLRNSSDAEESSDDGDEENTTI